MNDNLEPLACAGGIDFALADDAEGLGTGGNSPGDLFEYFAGKTRNSQEMSNIGKKTIRGAITNNGLSQVGINTGQAGEHGHSGRIDIYQPGLFLDRFVTQLIGNLDEEIFADDPRAAGTLIILARLTIRLLALGLVLILILIRGDIQEISDALKLVSSAVSNNGSGNFIGYAVDAFQGTLIGEFGR